MKLYQFYFRYYYYLIFTFIETQSNQIVKFAFKSTGSIKQFHKIINLNLDILKSKNETEYFRIKTIKM